MESYETLYSYYLEAETITFVQDNDKKPVINLRPEYFMCKLTKSFIIQTRTTLLIVKGNTVNNFAKTTHMNQDDLQKSRICAEPTHKKTCDTASMSTLTWEN